MRQEGKKRKKHLLVPASLAGSRKKEEASSGPCVAGRKQEEDMWKTYPQACFYVKLYTCLYLAKKGLSHAFYALNDPLVI